MPRRSKKADGTIGLLALIIGGLILLAKIILVLLPFILIGGGLYYYFKWQNKKLAECDNDWNLFYHKELKSKLKIAAIITPVLLGLGYIQYSNNQKLIEKEQAEFEIRQLVSKKQEVEKENIRLAFQAKKDSSQFYLDLASKYLDRKKYRQSIIRLDSALLIYPENHEAQLKKGIALKGRRKYKDAIELLDNLSKNTFLYKGEIHLTKGLCLLKLSKKKEARAQIYKSAELGNLEAEKLYNKINPIIKKITGYRRRCCDGTTSYASGKGACSHHGGVCRENDPIYTERRKYQL